MRTIITDDAFHGGEPMPTQAPMTRNEQILGLAGTLSFQAIADEVGTSKDVVAGVIWRDRQAKANRPIPDSAPKPRHGDSVFVKAMTAAIADGTEQVTRGIVKTEPEHFIPTVRPNPESGYRSSAGYTADQGTDIGGTS